MEPSAHRSTRTRAPRRLAAALGALALLALAAAPLPAAQQAPDGPLRSPRDLGNQVCAPYAAYCAELWRAGLAGGAPFNLLISEVCLHVRFYENEDAGIACLETGIHAVHTLPDSALVAGQFRPGERERNPFWHDRSDRQWAETVAQYFQRIPAFCDQATPVIYDYFPCLMREVHFFQVVIKRFSGF